MVKVTDPTTLLHHPDYRARYQGALKKELPRIPFVNLTPRPPPRCLSQKHPEQRTGQALSLLSVRAVYSAL